LAYFLYNYQEPKDLTPEERRERLEAAIARHFPGISEEERIRGYEIVTELMRVDAIEMNATSEKKEVELRRRKVVERGAELARHRHKKHQSSDCTGQD
jgi:hypothetical protein